VFQGWYQGLPEASGPHPAPGRRILMEMKSFRAVPQRHPPGSPFSTPEIPAPPAETYAAHDQVTHDKYGLGTILSVEEGIGLIVDFGSHKQRIKMPCSKLTKL
jgi:hypothetical protein